MTIERSHQGGKRQLARLGEKFGVDDMTVPRHLLLAGVVMRSPHERRR